MISVYSTYMYMYRGREPIIIATEQPSKADSSPIIVLVVRTIVSIMQTSTTLYVGCDFYNS